MEKQIAEKIRNADCNICKHLYFDPNDIEESQLCHIIDMDPKPRIDMNLFWYIINNPHKDKNITFCEYFEKDET